jgi:competence ComEA-like helix-hairpin-helix protein
MKMFKPHFRYNKRQRNGIFYLLALIASLQVVYYYIEPVGTVSGRNEKLLDLRNQIDSLKKINRKQQKIFRFNPNFITDAKGYSLGMTVKEIDRLLEYRGHNRWVNSGKEFQGVTKISDSLLTILEPQFVFRKIKKKERFKSSKVVKKVLGDLNTASAVEFMKIYGVGEKLSERIVKYRKLLGGFTLKSQLDEVWGLDASVVKKIQSSFIVKKKPDIKRIDVNSASFKEVLSIVYLDYDTTKKIFNYKDSVGTIKNLEELNKIEGFPIDKYDRIVLYLHAK